MKYITGKSGVGKTTLAKKLAKTTGTTVISLDDFDFEMNGNNLDLSIPLIRDFVDLVGDLEILSYDKRIELFLEFTKSYPDDNYIIEGVQLLDFKDEFDNILDLDVEKSMREDFNDEPDLENIEFYVEPETKTHHAIVMYKGARTRLRSGVLIVKGNKVLLSHEKDEDEWALPGGGLEEGETPIEAGIRECQEEVHINVKNCKETEHNYCTDKNVIADWVKEHVPEDRQWLNYYTFLLTAEYDSEYLGKVDKIDQDKSMLENMVWINIDEAVESPTFKEEWKLALQDAGYIKDNSKKTADVLEAFTEFEPDITWYHGTSETDITQFNRTINWFTTDISYAKGYGKVIYKCNINPQKTCKMGNTDVRIYDLLPIKPYKFSQKMQKIIKYFNLNEARLRPILDKLADEAGYDNGGYLMPLFTLVRSNYFAEVLSLRGYDSISTVEEGHPCLGVLDPTIITILNKPANEQLTEATRNQLISKSRNAGNYQNTMRGKNRFERKKFSKVANQVKSYNQIDMNKFFKQDILEVVVPVTGETNSYEVTIRLDGVVAELRRSIKADGNKFEYKNVIQAITKVFNTSNIYVKCTCPDFLYRFDHWSVVNNYGVDDTAHDPGPGKGIRNPDDSLGIGCKHVLLALANTDWIMKVASCIKNYIMYAEEHMTAAFNKLIFPKLYDILFDEIKDKDLVPEDLNLESEKHIIEKINDWAAKRGRYQKGSNKNPVTEKERQKNKALETE